MNFFYKINYTNLSQINYCMNCAIKFLFFKIHFFLGDLAYKNNFLISVWQIGIYLKQSSSTYFLEKFTLSYKLLDVTFSKNFRKSGQVHKARPNFFRGKCIFKISLKIFLGIFP